MIRNYLSLIKFSHTIFALPFAFIGFFVGIKSLQAIPNVTVPIQALHSNWNKTLLFFRSNWSLFFLMLGCMVFARSAAMAFNRYLDRDIDALNPRTAIREVPRGLITPANALLFTFVNCLLFIFCTYFINPICFYLSPVALAVVLGYSYTKRFTALCHLVLGLGLSLAPIGAFMTVQGQAQWLPVLFSCAVLFWVSGFDIIYALQDEDFDRSQHLASIPSWLGTKKALRVSEVLHLLSAAAIAAAGSWGGFGPVYWLGALVFGGMLLYQHSVVKPHDLRRVNLAFMTANGIASVVFAFFVIADILTR